MSTALIVSGSDKGADLLRDMLSSMSFMQIARAVSGAEARRCYAENDYDIIVINAPLPDEFGTSAALYATEKTGAGVLLLVKNELADEVSGKVEDGGVFVVPKPLNRSLLYGAVKLALAGHRRITALQKQNDDLKEKINDIRMVDRAKCALIQYRGLTENEAHKLIEQQAMDTRKSRREIARGILDMYEGPC